MCEDRFVITCEHGGNEVPAEFGSAFQSGHARALLRSHCGYDPGALEAARNFAEAMDVELLSSRVSRLLVDLNRSLDNPELFSKFSQSLSTADQSRILQQYYYPYRDSVRKAIGSRIQENVRVVHLSIHTFTSRIAGRWRPIDVGLLFDPSRKPEAKFCERWQSRVCDAHPRLRFVMNEPYKGTDDGLTTAMRQEFGERVYLGIEVEISNRYFKNYHQSKQKIITAMLEGITTRGR